MKKKYNYLIAFILPIIIFCLAMYFSNIYPFGKISLRFSDALNQYPTFFEGLKHFRIFNFNLGLGENFYPLFTSYLNNPLNMFYFLFKKENFDLFFALLILFKIGLIGLTMNILLNYKKEYNKKSLIFSTIYALSGYVTFYYWNYQFLDAIYMLPLIMIGIDKIVNENKNLMYYLSLTYMIIIHYYTAYMICLFSVIYFFFLLYNSSLKKEDKKKRIIKFFVTSLFCGLTSAYILIPTIYSFFQGRNIYTSGTNLFGINKAGIVSLYNFTIGSNFRLDNLNHINSAPIYISMLVFILVISSLFSKKNTKKYKKSVLIVLIIYLLSLTINFLYYGWHLFQEPVGIPGRFVFCFDAFLVLIAYQYFLKLENYNDLKKKLIFILSILSIILFEFKNYIVNKSFKGEYIYIIMLILSIIVIVYYLLFLNKNKLSKITYFIVLSELLVNVIMNINVNLQYLNFEYHVLYYQQKEVENEKIIENLKNESKNSFVRMHSTLAKNSALLYDYNGVSRYSSIFNANLNNFLYYFRNTLDNNLSNNHSTRYVNHFLMDALIGLKYIIQEYSLNKYDTNIFINKYVINSLGFMASNQNLELIRNNHNIEENLNLLTDNKYNLKINYLNPIKTLDNVRETESEYQLINFEEDGKVILTYLINDNIIAKFNLLSYYRLLNVDSNDYLFKDFDGNNIYKILLNNKEVSNIYELKKGDILKFEINVYKEYKSLSKADEILEYVKEDTFSKLINDLNSNIVTDIKINNDGFEGNLNVDDENLLVLTIPYDKGIEIKVDGVKENYEKCLDGVICLNINNGTHSIKMQYKIKGLRIGLIISIISFLSFWFLLFTFKYKKNK